jgi:uncharacterized membrane protein
LCLQPGGYWVALVILALIGCLTVVMTVALVQWRKVRQAEQQAVLTQDMLQRGMSAEEILRVLAACQGVGAKPDRPAPARLQETADYKG